MMVGIKGVNTTKPMAPDISLDKQRPAEYVFARHVEHKLTEIKEEKRAGQAPRQRRRSDGLGRHAWPAKAERA